MRSHLRVIFVCALTASLLWFFLRNAHLAQVWVEIRAARLDLLGAGLLVTAMTYVLRAVRWQFLLRPIGECGFGIVFKATVIGFAASFLLPARAGEVLRPYLLARQQGVSATAAFATIIFERLLDLITVVIMLAAFVAFFDPGMGRTNPRLFDALRTGAWVAAATSMVALGAVFVLAGHPERFAVLVGRIETIVPGGAASLLSHLVHRFGEGLGVIRQPRPLLLALAWSVPLWGSIALGIWLVSLAFRITLPYTGSFLLVVLLVVGVSMPTPGAVGGFHAAYQIGATAFYGAPNDRAIGAALVLHAISFVPVTLAGILFMARDGLSFARMRRMTGGAEGGDRPSVIDASTTREGSTG